MLLFTSICFANPPTQNVRAPITFQVVQNQMNINNSMIKNASIVTTNDGMYKGIQIELNPSATNELTQMTAANIGKTSNLVLNGKIYVTAKLNGPFAHKLFISGNAISKEDAQTFIDSLH